MRDFFESKAFKILLGIAVFLAGMMAYAGANNRLSAAPQEMLGVVLQPFQWVTAQVSAGAGALWEKYTSFDEVQAENEALREENKALKDQMVEFDRMQAELRAYQSLEEIQQDNPTTVYESAFVIGRDTLDSFGGFTINKGTLAGIQKGDTVVSDEGYLVGVVREADAASCKVMTVLHPSFAAAAVVSRTRDNGILCGNADYAENGLCTMTSLSRETTAGLGDLIITTGLGGVYPPDVLVGTVGELVPDSSGKSVVAVVRPGADVLDLTHVFVITDY